MTETLTNRDLIDHLPPMTSVQIRATYLLVQPEETTRQLIN